MQHAARILIVEDEVIVADDLADLLGNLGYACCGFAASGEDAVRKAARLEPDLILMDIHLNGGMDGIEAAARIRGTREVPIIYLTAFTDRELVQRAAKTEANGYLVKPFQSGELRANIELALYKDFAEKERKRLTAERDNALEKVKMLSGLLPICSNCKRIRDDQGYWQRLEKYIQEHSEALFSHSICPECRVKLYPEFYSDPE